MKILHVVPSFGLGGMEKVICSIVDNLSDGYCHEILALDNNTGAGKWIRGSHVRFHEFQRPPGRLQFFRALYGVLRERTPGLLMTYNWGATDAIWLGTLAGVRKIIHSEHGFNMDEAQATLWKRNLVRAVVYRLASSVIVVSEALARLMHDQYHLKPERVAIIPNGVDTDVYCPEKGVGTRIRKELGLLASDLVIGFAGRLDPVKNFSFMLEVFEGCLKMDQRFRLVIIGEGPEEEGIRTLCRHKGLTSFIRLVGKQDDVLPYLRALDMFLLTSVREQMPMSLLEAMAVELPIVASAVGDIPGFIATGTEGFVFALRMGSESFSQALYELADEATRRRMGRAARQKVVASLSECRMLQRYRELIGVSA